MIPERNQNIPPISDEGSNPQSNLEAAAREEGESTTYYEKLKTMVDAGLLDIKLLLSPPRTGSTLMETSFSRNQSITANVHEPFIILRRGAAEEGYKTIFDALPPRDDGTTDEPQQTSIVIKEMSHWLQINNEHERFLPLVESPPIILIRNPLLNTESRVKKILETLDLREKDAVQETLLNYYAHTKGAENWDAWLQEYEHDPDDRVADEAVRLYRRNKRLAELTETTEVQPFPLQRWLLDYYAMSKGFTRWKAMVSDAFDNRNFKAFEEILEDERIYGVDGTGWRATAEVLQYLDDQDKPVIIVDSTDYRLDPETIVPSLCDEWNIPFSEEMIRWGESGIDLQNGQSKKHQSIWYDRLQHSKDIEPPTEIAPILEDFPAFIAEQIATVDLPAYVAMFNRSTRVKPEESILQHRVDIPVKRKIYKRLRDIGLLPQDMSLGDMGEHDQAVFLALSDKGVLSYSPEAADSLQEAYSNGKATISLSVQDVDPIFAYLSNPGLLNDEEFRRINHRYLPTLKIVEKIRNGTNLSSTFAQEYLTAVKPWYYEGINVGTPESLTLTKSKLEPLVRFTEHPKNIVSVGVGAGEEVQAAVELFAPRGARVHGLDLSPKALELTRGRLDAVGLEADLHVGSATEMPFADESIDGIIESAILHEIYSYVPNGKEAWIKGIGEVAKKLSDGGIFLLRDFSAPTYKGDVDMTFTSDVATRFYEYFREYFRVFASWNPEEVEKIVDRRKPNGPDYPPCEPETNTVHLPFEKAAEVMLHFRIFHDRYTKGLVTFGDPYWKEINERYLLPDPHVAGIQTMTRDEYVATVISEANNVLGNKEYQMVCVQNESSSRPETTAFLAGHFTVDPKNTEVTNEELLAQVPEKMELVFKKVRKDKD